MPEHVPKYSSESQEGLRSLQNEHLSKMLVNFHLQDSVKIILQAQAPKRPDVPKRKPKNLS